MKLQHQPETIATYEFYIIGDWLFYPERPFDAKKSLKGPYRIIELLFGSDNYMWRKI